MNALAKLESIGTQLPDNTLWEKRFEIRSASSNRMYIVARNKKSGNWGCSCPGWRVHRKCKHLRTLGLLGYEEKENLS